MPEIQHISIKQLTLLDKNPRKIDKMQFEKLCRSIEQDPEFFTDRPCLVNRIGDQLIVYAGNQRYRAAKKLGWKTVPCIIEEISEDVQKRRVVQDNIHQGEFDYDLLSSLYDVGELIELGFTEEQLSIGNVAVETIESGEEDESQTLEPGKDEEAATKLGDVYELNGHRIVCGDSTLPEYVEKCFIENEAALCFTSPPYSDQREYNKAEKLDPKYLSQSIVVSSDFVEYFVVNLGLKRKDGEICPYWDFWIESAKNVGLKLLSWNVWDQGFSGSVGKLTAMFPIAHEWIFVFGSKTKKITPRVKNITDQSRDRVGNRQKDGSIKEKAGVKIRDFREMGTVFHSPPQLARDDIDHPARFPLDFPKAYIESMTESGEIVYDPFLGSGTTLIAAENLNRICYGIELSPAYVDIIVNRWINFMEKNGREYTIRKDGEPWSTKS